ncbi:MAG: hydroxymethylglutaryl-CoA lyase [Crocinitomicaceae bacterium]|jgi:hydroxymethylglutaryl-CoA lyase|nr:hydroxymethylglutaryl-CoA lyase [Crocinitomicaceae bacterium]
MSALKVIECPRDAMQGIKEFIPTETKVDYLNMLLQCNFDTLDFGSFVSPKAIPQMQDTKEVLAKLDLSQSKTKLLAIIANERGADEACSFDEISYLGYPFSISETFQQRNTNTSTADAFQKVAYIQNACQKSGKELVVYLSMGFGNPYGDPWNAEIVTQWSDKLYRELGISILALSDTIGSANPELVSQLFSELIPGLPHVEFGAHLHTRPENAIALLDAAYLAGCRRFDGAIKGYGGCPMAKDDLTGNMPTEKILEFAKKHAIQHNINTAQFDAAYLRAGSVFPIH